MDIEENDDIASALRSAMEESSAAEPEVEVTPEPERKRGPDGKFTANADDTEVEAAARLEPKEKALEEAKTDEAKDEAAAPQTLSVERPPSSWTPAAREKWNDIDPDIRQEIIRREEASMNGVRQIQERFQPMQQFVESMRPVAQEAQAAGMQPDQYIYNLASSERVLRTADLPTKFNELMRIADQYGLPLRDIINKSVGEEVIKAPKQAAQTQLPPEVAQELQYMRQWRENNEREQSTTMVETFGKDKDFFNDVRHQMADLVERGLANSLDDAYDKACWSNPEVRKVMLAREKGSVISDKSKAAAGASIKPGGKVHVDVDDDADSDDLAATIRQSYERAATGRI